MLLGRNDKNYPSIIIKYQPYLFHCQKSPGILDKVAMILFYLGSEKPWCVSDSMDVQADLSLSCWYMA